MPNENNANTLYLTAGDSGSITLRLEENGLPLILQTGDKVYFSVKKRIKDTEYAFQIVVDSFHASGDIVINISPEHTQNLIPSTYKYDIQITYADGAVTTVVKPSDFVIEAGVTHD